MDMGQQSDELFRHGAAFLPNDRDVWFYGGQLTSLSLRKRFIGDILWWLLGLHHIGLLDRLLQRTSQELVP
jgi:hypothetical protein